METEIPAVRFKDVQGNNFPKWKIMELGAIAEIKLGKMLDKAKHTSGRLLPYLNNISLRWNEVDTSNLPEMYFRDIELDRFGLKAGDIVVCEGGEPGRSAVWDGRLPNLKFQKAIHRVRFTVPFQAPLLVHYLERIAGTNRFEMLFTGGGIKHLTRETLASLKIPFPTLLEQRKIADFLMAVDGRIQQLIQKKALLEDYKKGVMQQLFTQAIRFKDDHGNDFPDWEENEFEQLAEKAKEKHNPTKSDKEWPCVELESLSQNTGKLLETFSSSAQKSIKNKFSAGEVLFGKLRPYLRKFLHAGFDGVCSSEIWVLRGKTVTNGYLYQLIQTQKFNQAANVSSGSKMPRSDWAFLSAVPFSHPSSPAEQTKIANFLSAIDRKIESVTNQIIETQTFKRGLLQQMFV